MFESLTRVYENKTALDPGSMRLRGEKVENVDNLLVVPVLVSEASVFGAEVFGINWKEPISKAVVKQVRVNKQNQASRLTDLTTAHRIARQIRRPYLPGDRTRQ
jgi:hypothetical protein